MWLAHGYSFLGYFNALIFCVCFRCALLLFKCVCITYFSVYQFTPVTSEYKVNKKTKHNCSIEKRNKSEKVAPAENVTRLEVE